MLLVPIDKQDILAHVGAGNGYVDSQSGFPDPAFDVAYGKNHSISPCMRYYVTKTLFSHHSDIYSILSSEKICNAHYKLCAIIFVVHITIFLERNGRMSTPTEQAYNELQQA